MRARIAAILAMAMLLCGCDMSTRRLNAFIENDDIILQVGSTVHFRYDPLSCQLSFSRSRLQFRAQTDNTSDYYCVDFSEVPSELGQTVTANLTWTTDTDILTRNNLSLEVVRIEGEKIWLWSSSGRVGVSCVILE